MEAKWLKRVAYGINPNHEYFKPYRKRLHSPYGFRKNFRVVDPLNEIDIP